MQEIHIYIDQSLKGLQRANGIYGYILEYVSNGQIKTLEDYDVAINTTAHELELLAITEALSRVTKQCIITIHSSHGNFKSAFMGHWIDMWKKNGWMTAKGKPVINDTVWQALDQELQKHTIIIGDQQHRYIPELSAGIKKKGREYVSEIR